MIAVGDRVAVRARAVAHGGSMLAEVLDAPTSPTVFLRYALPGEQGQAVVTGVRSGGRLVFADMVDVEIASPDRIEAPCRFAVPGGCGGCDFQHVALPAQRVLKADVLRDCLRRIGGMDPAGLPWDGLVHPVSGDQEGLRWRTRSRFSLLDGSPAMQSRRSSASVGIDDCLIAQPEVMQAARRAAGQGARAPLVAVHSSTGEVLAGAERRLRGRLVHEEVAGRRLEVGAAGFWQVHPGAPAALLSHVAPILAVGPNDTLLDLYAGVGLFGGVLAAGGPVHVVEGDAGAVASARRNMAGQPRAQVHRSPVLRWLQAYQGPAEAVVLDPPRSGAGGEVLQELQRLGPRAVAYVACDPAALARDLRTAVALGWQVTAMHGLDMFPMTHHLEVVVGLRPGPAEPH